MGAAQALIHVSEGVPGQDDFSRVTSALPNGNAWGRGSAKLGWIRVLVEDEDMTDEEIRLALAALTEPPDPDSDLDQQGVNFRWRFETSRLPSRTNENARQRMKGRQADGATYLYVSKAPNVFDQTRARSYLSREKAKGAKPKSSIHTMTLDEFMTCMVDLQTGRDGHGDPV